MAVEAMELKSQEMRKLAPELDPLRIGTGWKVEDLEKPQVMIESTYGDSHPGSGHLDILVEERYSHTVRARHDANIFRHIVFNGKMGVHLDNLSYRRFRMVYNGYILSH